MPMLFVFCRAGCDHKHGFCLRQDTPVDVDHVYADLRLSRRPGRQDDCEITRGTQRH